MGAGILWFMPVTPVGEVNRKGSLGSYYSVKDYYGINPEFGTLEDFKHLVNEIHKMGMYVIVDWVANHTSWDNPLMKEHPEWFMKNDEGDFILPDPGWTDVIDLNYENKDLWQYMINAMKYWLTETDIDGFRCDVAGMIPMEFWNDARPEFEKVKPVFMLAEAEGPDFHEKAFDATYSWGFSNLMNSTAKGEKKAADFIELFKEEQDNYPQSAFRMRFTSNHDINSWTGTEFERLGDAAGTFAVLTNIVSGIPLIYSGQEAGSDKRLKFFERDPIEWKDHPFKNIYSKLFNLRKVNEALYNGERGGTQVILETENKNVLPMIREKGSDKIFAVFNLSPGEASVKINDQRVDGNYTELFTGTDQKISGTVELNLKPWEYKVFVKTK